MPRSFFCFLSLVTGLLVLSSGAIYGQEIDLKGQTTIHIQYDNLTGIIPVNAQIYHSFPANDYSEVSDSISAQKDQVWLHLPVRIMQEGYVFVKEAKLNCILIPGDTIHLYITSSTKSPTKFHYSFEGRTKAVQTYYLAKKERFPVALSQLAMNAGVATPNLIKFKQQIDTLNRNEVSFWQQYQQKHALPAWFVRHESDAIRYQDAMIRLYMTWYQTDYQRKKQTIPTSYFTFLNQLPVRNKPAQYDYAYLNFLREYVGWKLKSTKRNISGDRYKSELVKIAHEILGNNSASFFVLWTISSGAKENPEVARTNLATTKFPVQYQYLVTYLKNRSQKSLSILQPGDKAPAFFLTDIRDSLVSLNQFKGKAVYLCFWFATCGGCFKEFPYENQLVDQFKGKPVQIVSICTITKPDKWRQTIKKVGLKTTNLFANPAWQKTLEEKYAISVYPHYVLIDADGRVVENFATRPSKNAAAKIKAVLAKMD